MSNLMFLKHNACIPSVNDRDLTTVSERTVLPSNGHAAKGSTTEIEVCLVRGATGALVGNYDCDGSSRTYALVQTPYLVAGTTPFTVHEQQGPHCSHSRPERLHIHHRTIPTCPTFTHHSPNQSPPNTNTTHSSLTQHNTYTTTKIYKLFHKTFTKL